ncbi:hypothetical protein [Streptomyces malaysiensis]
MGEARALTARGAARRTALLDAAIAVVAAGGSGSLTHRTVAATAKAAHGGRTVADRIRFTLEVTDAVVEQIHQLLRDMRARMAGTPFVLAGGMTRESASELIGSDVIDLAAHRLLGRRPRRASFTDNPEQHYRAWKAGRRCLSSRSSWHEPAVDHGPPA